MTLLTVIAMLGGITALLWFSSFIEARHLGPLQDTPVFAAAGADDGGAAGPVSGSEPAAPAMRAVDAA